MPRELMSDAWSRPVPSLLGAAGRRSRSGFILVGPAFMFIVVAACSPPPSVRAVDQWLTAYAEGDVARMVRHTTPADRQLVKDAMTNPPNAKATRSSLPPKPISHELLEIERKSADGTRHVVLCRVTMKNPLPYMSKRVGQPLDIPKTRTRRRRFLSVKGPDGQWGVKLDLARVVARTAFATRFHDRLARGRFDEAEAMLASIPPPPDEANAQKTKDRMLEQLQDALEKARTGARVGTSTSTEQTEP